MNKKAGFTLIEILIALTVFAILATATSSMMYYAFNTRARVNQQANRLNMVQLALLIIERDISQAIPRAVYGNEMHLFPAFVGQPQYFELTRLGFENPHSQEKRSNLQRIAYLCHDNQLLRRIWPTLDSTNRDHYEDRILLDNLIACRFSYLNHNLQVLPEWRENAIQQNQKAEPLPKAIQFNLTLKDWDKMSLLFIIPEALYVEQ
ncbi:GspJ family T2SS minor pseudopilin variant LspJ [Legionella hackeliae]|uniref:Type II secretion system protein J n=1 Tax=Legionella hackeliae TaxID=449 RepID=A0A0A8UUT3_LEGHA|nr:GspJ family T2SS minor pseudopilin variant LspJ [Legionella hackeliae]KTD09820.1 type II secretory pathway protein LspJ [Legionella hackeliae]CEK10852.1 LspJ [Legionella hackeliae]STX47588.1 general secretion pathway protein J [Legionella hackeliae]